MKTTTQILPGVKRIGWVECDHLVPNIPLRGISRMPVPILTDIHNIEFFGEPICKCDTERDGGGYIDTATLKFTTDAILPTRDNHLGFVVTDQQDNTFVIGAAEKPYPILKLTIDFGVPDGDNACVNYEVTHKAIKSLIHCNV